MNKDWFKGFVEGEGCFTIVFHLIKKQKTFIRPIFHFNIAQNELDVLKKIKEFLATKMINSKVYTYDKFHNQLRIFNIKDLQKLCNLLNSCEWISSKKYKIFCLWKEGIEIALKSYKRKMNDENFLKIYKIKIEIQNLKKSTKGRKPKIEVQEEIKNRIKMIETKVS